MRCVCLISILFFFASTFVSAQKDSLLGQWQNELGSILVIDTVSDSGEIVGAYQSSSGVDGKVFALQGFVNEITDSEVVSVAFSVRWEGYGSITSWTGFLDRDKGGLYLKTLWLLVRPGEQEPWERIITNSSTFRRSGS